MPGYAVIASEIIGRLAAEAAATQKLLNRINSSEHITVSAANTIAALLRGAQVFSSLAKRTDETDRVAASRGIRACLLLSLARLPSLAGTVESACR